MDRLSRNKLSITILSVIVLIIGYSNFTKKNETKKIKEPFIEYSGVSTKPSISLLMSESIEKYSDIYKVPKHIAYNVAFLETGYRGPFHWKYNHKQISSTGALGPMQIIPSTADYVNGKRVDRKELLSNIDLNVELSMKYLSYLYDIYGDWGIACGFYNTGYPIVNSYANYCKSKDYKNNWIDIKMAGF